jgi:hypothetical protein
MDTHFNAQLDRYYSHLEQLDADDQPQYSTWFVTTSQWEDFAADRAELDELLSFAVLDGLEAKVECIPF